MRKIALLKYSNNRGKNCLGNQSQTLEVVVLLSVTAAAITTVTAAAAAAPAPLCYLPGRHSATETQPTGLSRVFYHEMSFLFNSCYTSVRVSCWQPITESIRKKGRNLERAITSSLLFTKQQLLKNALDKSDSLP